MPLPWKKNKVARISRLVADLQSPKRGGSLVVETGFPTSLIDLFVKNRDRLKKKKSRPQSECSDLMTQQLPLPLPLPSPSISEKSTGNTSIEDNILRRVKKEQQEVVARPIEEEEEEEEEEDFKHDKIAECVVSVNGSKAKSVFVAVLRMFVVVVLALSTKKLVVGITMSAFALLFVEYAGKHVVNLFVPCLKAQIVLDSLIQRVLSLFRDKKDVLINKEIVKYQDSSKEVSFVSNSCGLIEGVEFNSSIEEIESVESNCVMVTGVEEITSMVSYSPSGDERFGCSDVETKVSFVEEEIEDRGEVFISNKNKLSKRAKIKAKFIKKFVPKKLRNSKKGKKCKEREPESSYEVFSRFEEHEIGEKQEHDDDKKSLELPFEEIVGGLDDVIFGSGAQSPVVVEMEEKVGRETKGNSGYLVVLLIVLAGLVGGRVAALVLTVVCCLMLGFVGWLRRSVNVPMIRSPVPISS